MIRTKDIMASLPLVASVLGDRYGVTVEIGGKTACTNGKTIILPTLPLDCDEKLLALARGFLDHEAAHIRDTDFEFVKQSRLTPLQMHLWNSIEDWRVEQKLSIIFPGCRQNLRWLIKHYFEEDSGAGCNNPALAVLNWLLLSVRSWEVPSIASQRDSEADTVNTAYPGLLPQMYAVLCRVRQECPDTVAAVNYALELDSIIAKYVQQTATASQEHISSTTQSDSVCQSEEDASSVSQSQSEQIENKRQLQEVLHASENDLPQNIGEWLANMLSGESTQNASKGLSVAKTGRKHVSPLADFVKESALRTSIALCSRLHGLLQAKSFQSCVSGRKGKLAPQRLHKLTANDPRLFLKRGEKRNVSTAVHILLDCSSSMSGERMALATSACYAASIALERCKGVNLGVTAFPAINPLKSDEIGVFPLVRHGERVHDKFNLSANGDTPLAEALWWVAQQMYPLKEDRKIILILSDGMPNYLPTTMHAIKQVQALGFELLGIGIQHAGFANLLPDSSRVIQNLPDLAPAMFDMLQNALLRQNGGYK